MAKPFDQDSAEEIIAVKLAGDGQWVEVIQGTFYLSNMGFKSHDMEEPTAPVPWFMFDSPTPETKAYARRRRPITTLAELDNPEPTPEPKTYMGPMSSILAFELET